MTRDDLIKHFDATVARMRETLVAKNADYSGAVDDALANFNRVELLGIAATETGFLTRMLDKLMRVSTFVARGHLSVADEAVDDTVLDLANYAILLHAQIADRRARDARPKPQNSYVRTA